MSDLGEVSRKLVAVFAADVEGYSRLMGADEVGTLKGLTERRAILDRIIGEHRGRVARAQGRPTLGFQSNPAAQLRTVGCCRRRNLLSRHFEA
jgi:class 3 adenylate cyclase